MKCQLIDLGQNNYRIESSSLGSRQGSLRDVVQFAVFNLNIDYNEIEYALVAMNALDHDGADFGVLGTFIFSFNTKAQQAG